MRCFVAAAAVMILACGCGGSGGPGVVPAGGTVTYKGEPVPNADVAFTAEGAPAAMGKTDDQGRFTLRTGTEDGAVPGTHQVSIYAVDIDDNLDRSSLPDPDADPEAYNTALEELMTENPQAAPKWRIPQKYGRALTSGLSFEVKRGEDNQFDIQLSD